MYIVMLEGVTLCRRYGFGHPPSPPTSVIPINSTPIKADMAIKLVKATNPKK
jgi:hypothetical protein